MVHFFLLILIFKSLRENVEKNLVRAERDNDLIYHQDVPTPSALPPVQETNLVNPTVPAGLVNPMSVIGTRPSLFEGLVGWGAREAISEYPVDNSDPITKLPTSSRHIRR